MSKMDIDGTLPSHLGANLKVCRPIPMAEVDNALLLQALELWRSLRNGRRLPSRTAINPRVLKPFLRNTTLIKVVDDGADYEYRIVGDAYVMAHGQTFQGKKWSEIGVMAPGFRKFIKPVYDRIVAEREPVAMRGWIERGNGSTGHVYCEYVYLPLGEDGDTVDHILAVAVYVRRDGLEHVSTEPTSSFTI